MQRGATHRYFRNIYQALRTILIGMRISLKYCFAKTITVQYPDEAPPLQPRFRGFHYYEIEKCIACDLCAKACPIDCIYIETELSNPGLTKEEQRAVSRRKIDKPSGIALGGPILRYAIDYSKCMFCGLCTDPCPTDCIHMGNVHDMSGYTRKDMIVEFTELAVQGLQTPQPLWMQKDRMPEWAATRRKEWEEFTHSDDKLTGKPLERREAMKKALEDTTPPKPDKAAKGEKAAAEKS